MQCSVGFIGGGNMSTAIARGIVDNGILKSSQLWVSGPNIHKDQYKHWKDMGSNTTTKNAELFNNCNIVFLGMKPHMLNEALDSCRNSITQNSNEVVVVSMLAGIKIKDLENCLSPVGPISGVIRIMPNTPMMVGHGACLVAPGQSVSPEHLNQVVKLLSSCSVCEVVTEKMINSLGSLTGCGPAFMYIIIEALADGAVKQGVPRAMATKMAAQMVVGSGQMVLKTGKHPGLLKDEVCSPAGSTICGVKALEDGRVRSCMIAAMEAAVLRTNEMGSGK